MKEGKKKFVSLFFPFFPGKRRKWPCIILRSELKIPSCDFHHGQTTVLAVNDPWAVTPLQFRRVSYVLWFVLEEVAKPGRPGRYIEKNHRSCWQFGPIDPFFLPFFQQERWQDKLWCSMRLYASLVWFLENIIFHIIFAIFYNYYSR